MESATEFCSHLGSIKIKKQYVNLLVHTFRDFLPIPEHLLEISSHIRRTVQTTRTVRYTEPSSSGLLEANCHVLRAHLGKVGCRGYQRVPHISEHIFKNTVFAHEWPIFRMHHGL
jgi:hypothetical protein